MPNGDKLGAQYFYLAQIQAIKGKCNCNVCKLLRKASDKMTEELLKEVEKTEKEEAQP